MTESNQNENRINSKQRCRITAYDFALVFISTTGFFNALLLALKHYHPKVSLIISVFATGFVCLLLKNIGWEVTLKNSRFSKLILLLVLLGITIRLPPTPYLLGGQDQGTYANIAHQYNKNGALYAIDDYRRTLTQEQKQTYDKRGNYILPSIEKWNREGSEYSMVFYPAYPSLLGVFEKLLGQNNMFYTLTLFSIVSLINIFLITRAVTKNKFAPLIMLTFLALNPVHAFFSKLPVGEMAALSFITTGFHFLTKYLKIGTDSKTKPVYLIFSLLGFFVFSLTRMTFFIYIPVFILIALFAWKSEYERVHLSVFAILSLGLLVFSYVYYRVLLYPLFLKIYPGTITKMFESYFPTNIPVNTKLIITAVSMFLVLWSNIKYNLKKIANKFVYPAFLSTSLFFLYKIFVETRGDFNLIFFRQKGRYDRWNLLGRGFDAVKHVPLIAILNYVSIFIFLIFIFLLIRAFITKSLSKYHFFVFISLYFLFIYVEKSGLMRYDYYNSRYYLTEVIPMILLTTGIYLGDLIQKGGWHKKIAITILSATLLYFSVFSFFQIGKVEGNEMDFYNQIDSTVSDQDLIIFINQNIYDSKYPKNFNDYVAGPLKYFFDKKVLVLEHLDEIPTPIVQSFFEMHPNVYYISNVPLENYDFATQEQKMTFDYNYFNNSPGCNYHNYEFLDTKKVTEIPLPGSLKCKLLPNAYFEKYRDYYFGVLK